MLHSIEELGEFADSNANGDLCIWKVPTDRRGDYCPDDKPWGARFGGTHTDHYGSTPDEAVKAALDEHDRARNPDAQL